jgi:hypothetical protein
VHLHVGSADCINKKLFTGSFHNIDLQVINSLLSSITDPNSNYKIRTLIKPNQSSVSSILLLVIIIGPISTLKDDATVKEYGYKSVSLPSLPSLCVTQSKQLGLSNSTQRDPEDECMCKHPGGS